jgi:hypothetical protein
VHLVALHELLHAQLLELRSWRRKTELKKLAPSAPSSSVFRSVGPWPNCPHPGQRKRSCTSCGMRSRRGPCDRPERRETRRAAGWALCKWQTGGRGGVWSQARATTPMAEEEGITFGSEEEGDETSGAWAAEGERGMGGGPIALRAL